MRQNLALLLAALLAVPIPAVAQIPIVSVGLARIGVAAAVRGPVTAFAPGAAAGRVIESGRPLYVNDHVTTGPEGRLQILLLDQTTFTLGPDSDMVLDQFVYDPRTNAGKISARILKGVFRFVTGKIAKKRPDDVRVTLPTGTIGVRGTMVAGRVEIGRSDVALLGPGPANNAHEPAGGITVSNAHGAVAIDRGGFYTSVRAGIPPSVPAPLTAQAMQGWVAKIDAHSSSNDVRHPGDAGDRRDGGDRDARNGPRSGDQGRYNQNQSNQAQNNQNQNGQNESGRGQASGQNNQGQYNGERDGGPNGSPNGGPAGTSGGPNGGPNGATNGGPNGATNGGMNGGWSAGMTGSAAEMSGQTMASGDARSALIMGQMGTAQGQVTTFASQDLTNTSASDIGTAIGGIDGLATWDEVRSITSGTGKYSGSGTYVCGGGVCGGGTAGVGATGNFNFAMSVDFANRTIGGSGSGLSLTSGPIQDSTAIGSVPFSALSGSAAVDFNNGQGVSNAAFTHIGFLISNSGGAIASTGVLAFQYQHPSGATAGGSAAAPMVKGP